MVRMGGGEMGNRSRMAGLSMVELMVTVLVLAMLMAIAVPSFRAVMNRGNVATAINSLSVDMQLARGQAASQHRFVSICRSTTGTQCDLPVGTTYDYDAGWIVYSYDVSSTGADQSFTAGSSNMTILRYTPQRPGVSIRATDGKVITFNQTGQFVTGTGRTTLTFIACPRKSMSDTSNTLGSNLAGMQGSSLMLRQSGSLAVTALPLTSTTCLP
nr:GspH/FimT family pseudopilin [Luteibacter rhizovicinus]